MRTFDLAKIPPSPENESLNIGSRVGKSIDDHANLKDSKALDEYLAGKALSDIYSVCPGENLVRNVNSDADPHARRIISEICFLSRPLIYGILGVRF